MARSSIQVAEERAELVGADGGEGVDAGGGEDVEVGDAAEVAPEGAVGGGAEVGVVVADDLEGLEGRAIGEGDVVLFKALLGQGGGGDDEDTAVAEAEEEEGAIAVGEAGECQGEGLAEEVEVANDRQRRRTGRQEFLGGCYRSMQAFGDEKEGEKEHHG